MMIYRLTAPEVVRLEFTGDHLFLANYVALVNLSEVLRRVRPMRLPIMLSDTDNVLLQQLITQALEAIVNKLPIQPTSHDPEKA